MADREGVMKRIKLTQGQFALVDDKDFDWLNSFSWSVSKSSKGKTCYAITEIAERSVYMHRLILGLEFGDGYIADHIDRNGLNNHRNNLRTCSENQSHYNVGKYEGKTSKFKGVSWSTKSKKWRIQIHYRYKNKHLGYSEIEAKAARIYDKAAKELFGEFAYLNFPIKEGG